MRFILVIREFVRLFWPMQTNPPSPIRAHIREVLNSKPKTLANWSRLLSGAAARVGGLKLNAYRPPRTTFFVRFGDLAKGRQELPIRVRYRGWEVGTISSGFKAEPVFTRSRPKKDDSALRHVFASLERGLGKENWSSLLTGCEWKSETTRSFFEGLRRLKLAEEYSELAVEEALVQSFRRRPKAFWFEDCSLVQTSGGASIPFKFTAPIVFDQTKSGGWDELAAQLALIKPTNRYGYPDILARCEGAIGGKSERLGVFELKKPGGYVQVSLLQAYAYAVAFDEMQKFWGRNATDSVQNLRKLLGYPPSSPKPLRFAAYAIVAEEEVAQVLSSKLTEAVLKEVGNDVLVGVLGYELSGGAVRLTSAVQRVGRDWKSFMEAAPANRRTVSFVA